MTSGGGSDKQKQQIPNTSNYEPWAGTQIGQWLNQTVGPNLEENTRILKALLSAGDTRIVRFTCLGGQGPEAALVFFEGLADKVALEDRIIRPLQLGMRNGSSPFQGPRRDWPRRVAEDLLPISGHQILSNFDQAVGGLTAGQSLLLLDGAPGGVLLPTPGWKERAVEAAPTETTIRGPKVGFAENLQTNIALVRRHVQDPTLRVEPFEVGIRSKTKTAVVYIEALARPALVEEIRRRISRIDMDYVTDVRELSELMQPGYRGVFPMHSVTERPDRVSHMLYDGKVAVLVDGTPDALLAPFVLVENLISMDDYYIPRALATFDRILRLIAWVAVVFTPALYVAVSAYNPDVLKVELAIVLAGARVGVPLNAVLEVVLMGAMMELLQEATIRLPSKIGSAATVVGGLIIGQAAAQARLISNIMVVIVAITAIASFVFPVYEHGISWRIVGWLNVAMAAMFGIFGVFASMLLILFYLNSLESYGVPYLIPFSPLIPQELLANVLGRQAFWKRKRRPRSLLPRDERAAVTGEEAQP